jgi:hypothetical protein
MTIHAAEIQDTEPFWLHEGKFDHLQRDPVDAVNDAEALVRFAQARLDVLLKRDDVGAHRF